MRQNPLDKQVGPMSPEALTLFLYYHFDVVVLSFCVPNLSANLYTTNNEKSERSRVNDSR